MTEQVSASTPAAAITVLVVTANSHFCAIEASSVLETMRPIAVEPVSNAPNFVAGVAVIRGAPTPVIELGKLLGDSPRAGHSPGRFVSVQQGERRYALAVDQVVGVRQLERDTLHALPAVSFDSEAALVEAFGFSDAHLLIFLRAARIVPQELWTMLEAERAS